MEETGEVLGPSPAERRLYHKSSRDDRAHTWATHDGHGISGHCSAAVSWRKKIPEDAAGVGDGRGSKEGSKETGQHQGLKVFGGGGSEGEADGHKHGTKDGKTAAIDLGERSPEQRTQAKPEQEESCAENGHLGANVELLRNLGRAGRVGRGRPSRGHGGAAIQSRGDDLLLGGPVDRSIGVIWAVEIHQHRLGGLLVGEGVGEGLMHRTGAQAGESCLSPAGVAGNGRRRASQWVLCPRAGTGDEETELVIGRPVAIIIADVVKIRVVLLLFRVCACGIGCVKGRSGRLS